MQNFVLGLISCYQYVLFTFTSFCQLLSVCVIVSFSHVLISCILCFSSVKGHLAVEDAAKPKPKASHNLSQTRSANFMEPTASHLAKKNAVLHDKQQSSNHFTRFNFHSKNWNRQFCLCHSCSPTAKSYCSM